MVRSLGKTNPLATEMIKVARFPASSSPSPPPPRLAHSAPTWSGAEDAHLLGSFCPGSCTPSPPTPTPTPIPGVPRFTMVMLVAAQPTPTLPCRDLATMPGNHGSSSSRGEGCGVREESVRGNGSWERRDRLPLLRRGENRL